MKLNLSTFNFKTIYHIVIFVCIFLIIFGIVSLCFYDRDKNMQRWNNIYNDNEKLDIVFFGNSHNFTSFNSEILTNEGIISTNIGVPAEVFSQTYHNIIEVVKNNKPKIIVIELNSIFYSMDYNYNDRLTYTCKNLYSMKMTSNRLNSMIASLETKDYIYGLIPLFLFHDNWADFDKYLYNLKSHFKVKTQNRGYQYIHTDPIKSKLWYLLEKEYRDKRYKELKESSTEISKQNLEYLEAIVDICNKEEIGLVFVKTPIISNHWCGISESLKKIKSTYGISIIDYNFMFEELKLAPDDFVDTEHLSTEGSIKITRHIKNYILKNYQSINILN